MTGVIVVALIVGFSLGCWVGAFVCKVRMGGREARRGWRRVWSD